MNRRNGVFGGDGARFQWGSYGFGVGIVLGILIGWMFHGFVGAFFRVGIAALFLIPLVLVFLAWRKFSAPRVPPPAQREYLAPPDAIETQAVVQGRVRDLHPR